MPDTNSQLPVRSEAARRNTAAFDLTRQHEIKPTEFAIGGAERAEIQESHRLVAVVTAFTVLFAAILAGLPIGIAVAHNWLAAILLLGLLRLFALCRNRQALL